MPLEKGNRKASFEYLNVTKERTPPLFRHVLQFEKSEAQEGKALSHTRLPWVYTCESCDGKVARDHQMAPEWLYRIEAREITDGDGGSRGHDAG